MNQPKPVSVMWLLNHTSARIFELGMLKRVGVEEVFTPKSFPQETSFRSASVTYETDNSLSIPANELAILNAQDWYGAPSKEAWDIANRHFGVLFFVLYKPEVIRNIARNFRGAVLWRAYGMVQGNSHGELAFKLSPNDAVLALNTLGRRFWFAEAYSRLHEIEPLAISSRSVYLPLGLADSDIRSGWSGSDKRVYFVCADLETNAYCRSVFESFKKDFSDRPYVVAGAQAIQCDHPSVLGFVSQETHERNMRDFRLMFYHSTEPHHVHYHPFEAIRAGMPLVFMAGGMLDQLGGESLPGRCKTVQEARAKIKRILNDDWPLIEQIRQSQAVLLEPMKAEKCERAWQEGFGEVLAELEISRTEQAERPTKTKRIAVIVPVGYRGGSLCDAKLLAQALYQGSRACDEAAEVVLLHLDDATVYTDDEFADLTPGIKRRAFNWKILSASEARRAMRYAGHCGWEPQAVSYLAVDDGIKQLQDCDLWVVVSDRLSAPLLPIRPVVLMVYDYLQRYVPILPNGADQAFLDAARWAARVLVTTRFSQNDALQYAGVSPNRVVKVPMLAPDFSGHADCTTPIASDYFVWTTNAAPRKNHLHALTALKFYYEELDGQLDCLVTGVNTANLLKSDLPHLSGAGSLVKGCAALTKRVLWRGELSDTEYRQVLSRSAFLWHAGCIDNGTFSVIEAASLGVPALSSDHPAMREIDEQFALNLAWMDANDPHNMAKQLKQIELSCQSRRSMLPTTEQLAEQNVESLAREYWRVVRECL